MERLNLPDVRRCGDGALVDVSTLSLDEIIDPQDQIIGRALTRLLQDVGTEGVLSAFNSFVAT